MLPRNPALGRRLDVAVLLVCHILINFMDLYVHRPSNWIQAFKVVQVNYPRPLWRHGLPSSLCLGCLSRVDDLLASGVAERVGVISHGIGFLVLLSLLLVCLWILIFLHLVNWSV